MINGLKNLNIKNIYCNIVSNARHGFMVSNTNQLYGFAIGENNDGQLGIGNKKNAFGKIKKYLLRSRVFSYFD